MNRLLHRQDTALGARSPVLGLALLLVGAAAWAGCSSRRPLPTATPPATATAKTENLATESPAADDPASGSTSTAETLPEDHARSDASAAPPPVPTEPLTTVLASLDPDIPASIPAAAAAFVARFRIGADVTEAQRLDALREFLHFADRAADRVYLHESIDRHFAFCKLGLGCFDAPIPEAEAQITALATVGVHVAFGRGGTIWTVLHYDALAQMLQPALSPPARAYLEARAWELAEINLETDDGGFHGTPAHVAQALARWEALATMHDAYVDAAEIKAMDTLHSYLRMCDSNGLDTPTCNVTEQMQASYASFPTTNPDSRYHAVVKAFADEMKARRNRANSRGLKAAIEAALRHRSPRR